MDDLETSDTPPQTGSDYGGPEGSIISSGQLRPQEGPEQMFLTFNPEDTNKLIIC